VILYPAIDIRDGRAVRLLQGDYEHETAYDAEAADAARRWSAEGAEILHVVDLDGARDGEPRNLDAVREIASSVDVPLQVGGGLRDDRSVEAVLRAGAERVVIGTAALRDRRFLERSLDRHGDRVVVSVDSRDGRVALSGWTEQADAEAVEVVAELGAGGVTRFLCTSIAVDGTMEGPALEELGKIAGATEARIIASGGVGSLADLRALAAIPAPNLEGAIVGRALYEKRFTVSEARDALSAA
jgi:phosphoribosylformimino-5-aminoimidazole carboxamide ribotide isomerase